jgi:hypothetical protein
LVEVLVAHLPIEQFRARLARFAERGEIREHEIRDGFGRRGVAVDVEFDEN